MLYENKLLITYGNFIFRYRDKLFPLALLIVFVAFPTRLFLGGDHIDLVGDIAAVLLGLIGESLRVATVGLEYIKRGGLNKKVYAKSLVVSGMFAHCRNPLYVGNIILALALLTMLDNVVAFAIGAVVVLITYVAIVAAEERYLRGQFGPEYDVYAARVNRWVPDFRGVCRTFEGFTFNWRRVLLKEFSSFYGWVTAAFLIEMAMAALEGEFDALDVLIYTALFLAATAAFLTIRLSKMTGWLRMQNEQSPRS